MKNEQPIVLSQGAYNINDLNHLLSTLPTGFTTYDIVQQQLIELYKIRHPELIYNADFKDKSLGFVGEQLAKGDSQLYGDWVYFPWSNILLHMSCSDDIRELVTNRNRNLITNEERDILSRKTLAVVGLSVGSHFVTSFAYSGIGGHIKLADFDTLETSNLNRIHARLVDVGLPKITIAARNIYDINPHASVSVFPSGLTEDNLEKFFENPKPDLIFEAIDDFRIKIRLRIEARKLGIPVVMITSLGDNILVDIERYDQDNTLPLFHGIIGSTPEEILFGDITPEKEKKFALTLVGREHIPQRAISSVEEIGKTLVGRPQLASTVFANGGIAAYLARKIFLNELTCSGRFFISIDQLFVSPEVNPHVQT